MQTADCRLGLKCRVWYKIGLGPGLGLGLSLHFTPSLQSAFYTDRFTYVYLKAQINRMRDGSGSLEKFSYCRDGSAEFPV